MLILVKLHHRDFSKDQLFMKILQIKNLVVVRMLG